MSLSIPSKFENYPLSAKALAETILYEGQYPLDARGSKIFDKTVEVLLQTLGGTAGDKDPVVATSLLAFKSPRLLQDASGAAYDYNAAVGTMMTELFLKLVGRSDDAVSAGSSNILAAQMTAAFEVIRDEAAEKFAKFSDMSAKQKYDTGATATKEFYQAQKYQTVALKLAETVQEPALQKRLITATEDCLVYLDTLMIKGGFTLPPEATRKPRQP